MVMPLRIEIDSGVVAGPTRQDAPLSISVRAAESAACGSPCESAATKVTVAGTPASLAALLATCADRFMAFSDVGPSSESGPVDSRRLPIVRLSGSAPASVEPSISARAVAAIQGRAFRIFHDRTMLIS